MFPLRLWSNEIVERLGIERDILPHVYESHEVSGRVSKAASVLTGLKEGTPVEGGAGDSVAGAVEME